jgi:glycosyltransferase involved in cell wall biosynthesis
MKIGIVIPALDEAETVGRVVRRCRTALEGCRFRIVVADNGSVDTTAAEALGEGAEVVVVPVRGYGRACSKAIEHLSNWPDVLVFLDGDGSSRPEEIPSLLEEFRGDGVDLVLGRRSDTSAMTLPQKWGTRYAVWLVNSIWGTRYADMGPFRAVRASVLHEMGMADRTWGWTVEMQILAAAHDLTWREVDVGWDQRAGGRSKISGSVMGVLRAGGRILWTVAAYSWRYRVRFRRVRQSNLSR